MTLAVVATGRIRWGLAMPMQKDGGEESVTLSKQLPPKQDFQRLKTCAKRIAVGTLFQEIVFSSLSFSVLSETVPLRLWDNLWVHGGRRVRNTSLDDVVCKSGWNARNWTAARKRPTTDERVFLLICLNGVGERKRYRCHADAWDNCTLCSLLPLSEWVFCFSLFLFPVSREINKRFI